MTTFHQNPKQKYDFIEEINITDTDKSEESSSELNDSLKENIKSKQLQNEESIRRILYKTEEEAVKKLNLFTTEEKNNIFYSIRLRQSKTELNLKKNRNKTKEKISQLSGSKTMKTIKEKDEEKEEKEKKKYVLNSQTPIHQKSNKNILKFSNKFLPMLENSTSMKMIINASLKKKEYSRSILDKNLLKLKEREDEIDSHSIPDKLIRMNNIKYEKGLITLKADIESNIKSLQSKNENRLKLIKEMSEDIKGLKLKQYLLDTNEGRDVFNFPTHSKKSLKSIKNEKNEKNVKIADVQNKLKRNIVISNEKTKIEEQIAFNSKFLKEMKSSYEVDVSELNLLKQQLKFIKNDLLFHYHNILYESKDLRNQGLSWVIKAIYDLGYEVILTYLPSFFDQKCIEYLFNKAHVEIEMEEMKIQIQVLKFTIRLLNNKANKEVKDNKLVRLRNDKFEKNVEFDCGCEDESSQVKDIFSKTKLSGSLSNKSIYNKIKTRIEEIIHSQKVSFDSNEECIKNDINKEKTYNPDLYHGNNDFQMSNIKKLDSNKNDNMNTHTKTSTSLIKKFRMVDKEKKKLSFITKDDIKFFINTKKLGNKHNPIEIQKRMNRINNKILNSQEGFEYLFDEEGFSVKKLSNLMKFYEKTNVNSEQYLRLNELHTLEMKEKELRSMLIKMRDEEMSRIFKEFLLYNYSKRFKIEKIFLIRSLIGDEDIVLKYMNDHVIKEKEYIENIKHIKIYNNI